MKITNQHVGYLIWTLLSSYILLYYFGYVSCTEYEITKTVLLIVSTISCIMELITVINSLLFNDIRFEFNIDLSFGIKNYFESKRKLNEEKEKLYMKLLHANTDDEIDILNRKLELLKNT